MRNIDFLIVGGGVAGTSAAEVLRQHDRHRSIHIIASEHHRFYERKMLSKPAFFLGKIPFDTVYIKPAGWFERHHITSSIGQAATTLDAKGHVVTTEKGERFHYGKLLIATGTRACPWEVPGAELEGVMHLRTLDDAKELISSVRRAKSAIVIGGGFIGFEMCHLLATAGISTTVILRESYFWEPMLDAGSAKMIEAGLEQSKVHIQRQVTATEVLGKDRATGVRLSDGRELSADMILVGIGTRCPMEWVAGSGLNCHRGIIANAYLETSAPDIWVAGDVAEYHDLILHEDVQMGSWLNAHLQGKAAALNMLGHHRPYHHVSFYHAKGFGLELCFTGDIRLTADRRVIERGHPSAGAFTRIIVSGERIIGATMINRLQDLAPLTRLVERETPIAPFEAQLADPAVDLRSHLH